MRQDSFMHLVYLSNRMLLGIIEKALHFHARFCGSKDALRNLLIFEQTQRHQPQLHPRSILVLSPPKP
jgi:hypothetical protein